MNSTFFGLELSRRALDAQQLALNTTGHNIANANTDGYTRQEVHLTATTPDGIVTNGRTMSVGTGVTLDKITRARDAYVDKQLRLETAKQEYWGAKQDNLSKIEDMTNEPDDSSLSSDLNKFWTAWSDLSNNPEDEGARAVVQGRAQTLTDSLHSIATQISDMQNNLNSTINDQINEINDYAKQIKTLNDQIRGAEIGGDTPNDLMDKRDQLVDELSKIVNVNVTEIPDPDTKVNSYKLEIGDPPQTLVDNGVASQLKGVTAATGLDVGHGQNNITAIQWVGDSSHTDGDSLSLGENMGTLQADIETRDTYLTELMGKYDSLAKGIVTAVNDIHKTGTISGTSTTDVDFFDADNLTASSISLDSSIASDYSNIVTGDGTSGDGSIASAIASLATGWSTLTGTDLSDMKATYGTSLGDTYAAMISSLGVDVQQANRMKDGEDVLVTNLTNQRDSVSGVSLDEEMTNLIMYQKSYTAAARMVTMMDDMLDTLLNMGVTK